MATEPGELECREECQWDLRTKDSRRPCGIAIFKRRQPCLDVVTKTLRKLEGTDPSITATRHSAGQERCLLYLTRDKNPDYRVWYGWEPVLQIEDGRTEEIPTKSRRRS